MTRHPALVELLHERGIVGADVPVVAHVQADDIRGKDVVGVLPSHLAAEAATVTEIPLALELEDRKALQHGDLGLERMRTIAGPAVTYRTRIVDPKVEGAGRDFEFVRSNPSWAMGLDPTAFVGLAQEMHAEIERQREVIASLSATIEDTFR